MRFSLAIGALLASSFPVMSQVSPNPVELNHFADSVMECLISREEVAAEAEATRAAISALPDRLSRLVHEAQRLFLLGWAELGFNRQRLGEQLFERAIKVARESIELEPTSEGYRVLADGLNQLLNVRGPAYKLFNHQTTRRSSLTAVELDETNALAHISAAGYLISAPVITGWMYTPSPRLEWRFSQGSRKHPLLLTHHRRIGYGGPLQFISASALSNVLGNAAKTGVEARQDVGQPAEPNDPT